MKYLLLTACLLLFVLVGCAALEHTDRDGNVTKYWRIGEQSIGVGSVTLPDGTVLNFTEQKSTIPVLIVTPTGVQLGEGRMP